MRDSEFRNFDEEIAGIKMHETEFRIKKRQNRRDTKCMTSDLESDGVLVRLPQQDLSVNGVM